MTSTSINKQLQESAFPRILVIRAYAILLFSLSVTGFWQAFVPQPPAALVWVQTAILLLLFLVTQFWPRARPLRGLAMLETKGITWPWICHFAADAAVFISLAILFV